MPNPPLLNRQLTPEEKTAVLSWIGDQLVSWPQLWSEFDVPGLAQLRANNGWVEPPQMRTIAEAATLQIGGSHGGMSSRPNPTFTDIDVFWKLPESAKGGDTALLSAVVGILKKRLRPQPAHLTADDFEDLGNGVLRRITPKKKPRDVKIVTAQSLKFGGVCPALPNYTIKSLDILVGFEKDGVLWYMPGECVGCKDRHFSTDFTVTETGHTLYSCCQ